MSRPNRNPAAKASPAPLESTTGARGVTAGTWTRPSAVSTDAPSAPAVAITTSARPRSRIRRMVRSGSARAVAETKTMSAPCAKGSW